MEFRLNLRRGDVVNGSSTVTADGFPATTEVHGTTGTWTRYGSRGCWKQTRRPEKPAPFLRYDGEWLAIASRDAKTVVLSSTAVGFNELDSIDPRTYDLLSDRTSESTTSYGVSRSTATFTYLNTHLPLPRPVPRC